MGRDNMTRFYMEERLNTVYTVGKILIKVIANSSTKLLYFLSSYEKFPCYAYFVFWLGYNLASTSMSMYR